MTAQRFVVRPHVSRAGRGSLYLLPGPAALRALDGRRAGLHLDFQVVAVAQRPDEPSSTWRIEPQMYEYRLLDGHHTELLVYHWQPELAGPDFPHLHVSASLDAQFDALTRREIDLDKRHLVTGPVTMAAFVRMLITDFDILPLCADWQARLAPADTH